MWFVTASAARLAGALAAGEAVAVEVGVVAVAVVVVVVAAAVAVVVVGVGVASSSAAALAIVQMRVFVPALWSRCTTASGYTPFAVGCIARRRSVPMRLRKGCRCSSFSAVRFKSRSASFVHLAMLTAVCLCSVRL